MKKNKNIGNSIVFVLSIGLFLFGLFLGIILALSTTQILNFNSLISGAFGAFFGAMGGGLIALWVSIFTQNRNWNRQREKEEQKMQTEENQLFVKFFMELNYNKRKLIYTIENDTYKLTGLDNLHWKNFIYSKASIFLLKDKNLIDDLATLDSMVDQVNNSLQSIKETEKAIICNIGHSVIDKNTPKKHYAELRNYIEKKFKPYLDKTINKLKNLHKEHIASQS